jgi:fatty acid synthase subunit alpha, fungi type
MAKHDNKVNGSRPCATHIAHKLLIELLACQFAFPVRWIETQDELFSRNNAINRLIEFGPAKILGGMAKQTIELKYKDHDTSKFISRQFLCSELDRKKIDYEYDSFIEEPIELSASSKVSTETPNVPKISTVSPSPTPLPASKSTPTATKISDVQIQARDVILSLVARKFNKGFDNLDLGKSIKELSGGKSALQNELIGILEEEFKNLPTSAEDLPLSSLSEQIQPRFLGSLGKESSSLISKFVSTKMPAGFSQNAVRDYLESTWGLGAERQTAVLLFSVTSEPPSRLPSINAAKEYFDSLLNRYASFSGISLSASSGDGAAQSAVSAVVDSKELDKLRQEQRELLSQKFNLLASQLNIDPSNAEKIAELETMIKNHETRLDEWNSEFETEFESGVASIFDPQKKRRFNSWWNLAREDIMRLYHDTWRDELSENDELPDVVFRRICNRYTPSLGRLVDHLFEDVVGAESPIDPLKPIDTLLSSKLAKFASESPRFIFANDMTSPLTTISPSGKVEFKEVPRKVAGISSYVELVERGTLKPEGNALDPYILLKCSHRGSWQTDIDKTNVLLDSLRLGTTKGFSFSEKTVLLTGASPGSIGDQVLRGLIMGGARAIVTTSRPPAQTAQYYQDLYAECGSKGSELILLPFNQGSKRDCESLINYIYSDQGLATNLDAVIPFAAISETAEIDGIKAKSELAHRIMLVNLVRLLGNVVRSKDERKINTRPTQVLLPLSPNHGTFGGDGLYGESKLGLESLMNRFKSESWSEYLSICGAIIGWTRGTGLMAGNDLVAQAIESHNVLTFSQSEMAFNLLALMSSPISSMCEAEPIMADLGGGLGTLADLKKILAKTRADIDIISKTRIAIKEEDAMEDMILNGPNAQSNDLSTSNKPKPRSTLRVGYPTLPNYDEELLPLQDLQGMVNLDTVPVIVGLSELGPWGSARTRWEMESKGSFTQEGYIEMAWLMNLIKYYEGEKNGSFYAGWIDFKTGEPVHDSEVESRYGEQILAHSGIRLVEPQLFEGYDPDRKEFMHEVALEADLPEFEANAPTAKAFKLRHGDKASIQQCQDSENFKIKLKQGAVIAVPKSIPFEGIVAGQIPTGWDPSRYGIPEDIRRQVDPVTLYTLCCVSEALYGAGISESMEIFKHIHVSELGNFIGSMMGGTTKTRGMYKDRYMDKDVQGDVMQETYLSTTAAWINMLLLGASGPIKTPTGACATAVESIDSACEALSSGKIKMCFVGGTDDFQEEESYAFRTMKATVDARKELANGRLPREMSRPTSDTRAGFVESQGSGVQIITTAKLALDLGLPIYGIIAASTMAADKISRSVPAPGQGVLSFAKETAEAASSPLLQLDYRREQLDSAITTIQRWKDLNLHKLYARDSGKKFPLSSKFTGVNGTKKNNLMSLPNTTVDAIEKAANAQIAEAQRLWGNEFRKQDPDISPLRASLAVWGLTIDDIDIASLHGTSTKANDKNEPDILNKQMSYLGRNVNQPLLAICQKALTGHPKAPAAAFMLNGCLQALNTGLVPGNRNADNVDIALSAFPHLVFPTRPIQTQALKAFSLTSFGFGQKGGQIIGVHPRYLFATLDRASYTSYCSRTLARTRSANQAYLSAMNSGRIVKIHSAPQYASELETTVLLDPLARISEPIDNESWRYDAEKLHQSEADDRDDVTLCSTPPRKDSDIEYEVSLSKTWVEDVKDLVTNPNVGIDVEDIRSFRDRSGIFYERNYTSNERLWASQAVDPISALAGRWSAKEAVFKSLGVKSKGAAAPLKEIEILSKDGYAPTVKVRT